MPRRSSRCTKTLGERRMEHMMREETVTGRAEDVQKRIVTLTINPTLDKSTQIERAVPNEKLRCEQTNREPGGGGINVSRAIQRLGDESLALYPCGGPRRTRQTINRG
jgi:hypothetical protein